MTAFLARLEQRASRSPEELVLQGVEASVTPAGLLGLVRQLGDRLLENGSGPVALYADNSPWWAVVDLACQLNGICLVPVPTFFSAAQVTHLLHSAGVERVIVSQPFLGNLPAGDARNTSVVANLPGFSLVQLESGCTPQVPARTSKITFTSGSTGEPKGVCLSFEQCLRVADSLATAIEVDRPRHLCVLPLSTLLENIGGIYTPLLSGGSSVLLSADELGMRGSSGIDARCFLGALHRYQPNTLILVPQLLAVLDAALAGGWRAPDSLRFVAVGGARVAPAAVRRVRAKGVPVYEGYGLSECASVVSLNSGRHDRPGTSGRVLPHVRVVEEGGELLVSGNTFLGYLNQPESWGVETVATGDVGRVDEGGFVTVAGRSKNTLITSFGRNVSPEWVESELLAGNLFRQAVVMGDGRPCCVALLYPLDPSLDDAAIQAAVDETNATLPDYARVGHWLRLVEPLDSTRGMMTDNGRPRRKRIAEHFTPLVDQLFSESTEIGEI